MTTSTKCLLVTTGLGFAFIGALALWPVPRESAGASPNPAARPARPPAVAPQPTARPPAPPPAMAAAQLPAAAPAAASAPLYPRNTPAAVPPPPPATMAGTAPADTGVGAVPGAVADRYAACEVLAEKVGPPDTQGRYERVRVVKTEMKYPLVRVVERRVQGSGVRNQESGIRSQEAERRHEVASHQVKDETANDTLLSQTAMVADHVTLKVKAGTTAAELAAYARAQGGEILKKLRVPGPGTYLVKLAQAEVDTVPRTVAALGRPGGPVAYVHPDYLVYACETIPDDEWFGELWGMRNIGQAINGSAGTPGADIKATAAWDLTTGNRNALSPPLWR